MQIHTFQFICQVKDLGVIFNSRLSFDAHINDKVCKANEILELIRRTFAFFDELTLVQLYEAFVGPHLGLSNWSPSLRKNIEIIENVQRRAAKLVLSVSHLSYPDRLARLNLPILSYGRATGDMIEVIKIKSNIYNPKVTNLLTYRDHTLPQGSQIKEIYQPFCHSSIYHNCFSIHICIIWNSLHHDVVEASSLNIF